MEQDLLILKSISTHDNSSDAMTKNTPKLLFNRHMDFILGRSPPEYATVHKNIPHSSAQTDTVLSTGGWRTLVQTIAYETYIIVSQFTIDIITKY